MKTLIIFDIDGTLTLSESRDSISFAESYTEVFGKDFNTIDWRQYQHVTDHTIFHSVYQEHFGQTCPPEELDRFQSQYVDSLKIGRQKNPHHFREVPGAKRLLEQLHQDDRFVLGIGTGGWRAPQLVKLDHVDISVQQIYDSYADNKETREQILQASIDESKKHHDIQKVVYIGDAIWDFHTTNNMNLPFIGIRNKGDHEFFTDRGVRHVLTDLSDTNQFLGMVDELVGV